MNIDDKSVNGGENAACGGILAFNQLKDRKRERGGAHKKDTARLVDQETSNEEWKGG